MSAEEELAGGTIEPWDHGKPHCRLCHKRHWAREGCNLGGVKVIKEHKDKVLQTARAALGLSSSIASAPAPTAKPIRKRAKKKAKRRAAK